MQNEKEPVAGSDSSSVRKRFATKEICKRQKLKHVDGDFPWCMRRKSEDNEAKRGKMKTQEVKEVADKNSDMLTVTFH